MDEKVEEELPKLDFDAFKKEETVDKPTENYESLIKGEVDQVIGAYTKEEAEANKEAIADEILTRIQELYDSNFIVDVVFTGWNLS